MQIIGERAENVQYYKRPSVYAIIEREEDNKVGIATDGLYFFLGGGIEKDETELEALKREVIEEAGYTLKNIRYFDTVSSFCYSETNGYMDVIATLYIATFDKKISDPIETDHEVLWVDPLEYKDKLYHEYQRYLLNKYVSEKKGISCEK